MKLNRTESPLSRTERNKINENWQVIESKYNNTIEDVVDLVTEETYQQIIDSSKLEWQEPVDNESGLPSEADEGDTRMARDTGKVYRYNGTEWQEIQQIDAGPVNELENRVNAQLAQETEDRAKKEKEKFHGYYEGAVVSFAFDDGAIHDWTRFKPIFESEGVPGIVSPITSRVGKSDHGYESMSWEQLKELKRMGWTVASHTHTHTRPAEMTAGEIDFELRESSRLLQEHGLDHDIIVYPFGDVSNGLYDMARKYYKMGINIPRYNLSNEIPDIDNLNLTRVAGLSKTIDGGVLPTLEQCKSYVDDAIEYGKYIIFEDHAGLGVYNDSAKLDELRELIQYIKSKDVPIVNAQDGFNMKCNVVDMYKSEYDYYRLHRNGQVSQGDVSFLTQSKSGFGYADTPPSQFQTDKITFDRITGAFNHDEYAYRTTSLRYTYKITEAPNSWYQEVINPNGRFIRWVDRPNDDWTSFKRYDFVAQGEVALRDYEQPPSSFKPYQITVDRLIRDLTHDSLVYHDNSIRLTHKETEAPNTWFQEVINRDGHYYRWAVDSSTWGEWVTNFNRFQRVDSVAFNINANSTTEIELDVPGLMFLDQITVVPYNYINIPSGIMFQVYKSVNNKVTMRFANITSSEIQIPGIAWAVTFQRTDN